MRRANRVGTRVLDIENAITANNATSWRRYVATTHRESRNADSKSLRTSRTCKNGGKLTVTGIENLWRPRRQISPQALLDRQVGTLPSFARLDLRSRKRTAQKDKHMHPLERTRSRSFDIFKPSVRVSRPAHGSSRDIRGKLVLPPFSMSGESEE